MSFFPSSVLSFNFLTHMKTVFLHLGNLNLNGVTATPTTETAMASTPCNNSAVDSQNGASLNGQKHQTNIENNNNILDTYNRELSKKASLLEHDHTFDCLESQKIMNVGTENAKFVASRRINRNVCQDPEEVFSQQSKSHYSLRSQKLIDDDEISVLFGSRDTSMNPSSSRLSNNSGGTGAEGLGSGSSIPSMMSRRFSDDTVSSRMSPALVSPTGKFKSIDPHSISFTNASAVPSPFLDEAPG